MLSTVRELCCHRPFGSVRGCWVALYNCNRNKYCLCWGLNWGLLANTDGASRNAINTVLYHIVPHQGIVIFDHFRVPTLVGQSTGDNLPGTLPARESPGPKCNGDKYCLLWGLPNSVGSSGSQYSSTLPS